MTHKNLFGVQAPKMHPNGLTYICTSDIDLPLHISTDDAVNLALWLVIAADPDRSRFDAAWREQHGG